MRLNLKSSCFVTRYDFKSSIQNLFHMVVACIFHWGGETQAQPMEERGIWPAHHSLSAPLLHGWQAPHRWPLQSSWGLPWPGWATLLCREGPYPKFPYRQTSGWPRARRRYLRGKAGKEELGPSTELPSQGALLRETSCLLGQPLHPQHCHLKGPKMRGKEALLRW